MGDLLSFPTKPTQPEGWPWCTLRAVLEDQAKKLSDGLPESAPAGRSPVSPAVVTGRMKPDVLKWIDRCLEITQGVGPFERERLTLFLAELIADRLLLEIEVERSQA